MKRMLMLLALCASVTVPAAALAQAGPRPGAPPPSTPEQRAMMEKLRTDSKTAAYNALTPGHRDRVTAIVADVAAGKQDARAAAKVIDDLLAPDEQKAVRDAATASFRARRAAMGGPGGPPPGPPNAAQPGPNGPPPPRSFGPGGGGRFSPSAGRYLLMVSISRDQMRKLMPQARTRSGT